MAGDKRRRYEKAADVPRKAAKISKSPKPLKTPVQYQSTSIHERGIAGLEAPHPTRDILWGIIEPSSTTPIIVLPELDITLIQAQLHTDEFEPSKGNIRRLLRSGGILCLLHAFVKHYKSQALEDGVVGLLRRDHAEIVQRISQMAMRMAVGEVSGDEAVNLCARHAWLLANKNQHVLINNFRTSKDDIKTILSTCAAILLTLVKDLQHRTGGFFSVLLQSRLVWPMPMDRRAKWEVFFPLQGEGERSLFVEDDEELHLHEELQDDRMQKSLFKIAALTAGERLIHQRACDFLVRLGDVYFSSLACLFAYRTSSELFEYHLANKQRFRFVLLLEKKLVATSSIKVDVTDEVYLGKVTIFERQAAILEVLSHRQKESFPAVCPWLTAEDYIARAKIADQANQSLIDTAKAASETEIEALKDEIRSRREGADLASKMIKSQAEEKYEEQLRNTEDKVSTLEADVSRLKDEKSKLQRQLEDSKEEPVQAATDSSELKKQLEDSKKEVVQPATNCSELKKKLEDSEKKVKELKESIDQTNRDREAEFARQRKAARNESDRAKKYAEKNGLTGTYPPWLANAMQ